MTILNYKSVSVFTSISIFFFCLIFSPQYTINNLGSTIVLKMQKLIQAEYAKIVASTPEQPHYLKEEYLNDKLNREYIYDSLGRVVKERKFNKEGQVPRFKLWLYDGNSKLAKTCQSYKVNKDNTIELKDIIKYEYDIDGELIKEIRQKAGKNTPDSEYIYQYDNSSICPLKRMIIMDHTTYTITTTEFEYINDRCSYISSSFDGKKRKTETYRVEYDNCRAKKESLNLYSKIRKHNVVKRSGSKLTEVILTYNDYDYPVSMQLKGMNAKVTYVYDVTMPSPIDTTVVTPF